MPPLAQISGNARRRTETSQIVRAQADQMRSCGHRWARIAQVFSRPESTLRKAAHRHKDGNYANRPRLGRPKTLTEHQKRAIWRWVHQQPRIEYKELLPAVGLTMRQKTSVYRWLDSKNVHKWRAKRRPLLTSEYAAKRLTFAEKWRPILDEQSVRKIAWSDEMYCHFSGQLPRYWVFRRVGEQYDQDKINPTKRPSGKWVMAWAACWSNTSTEIQFIEKDPEAPRGGCSARTYRDMLADQLPQFLGDDMCFQHDNARIHTAQLIREYLDENNITYIDDWPPYSPDLDPIEHLWSELRDRLVHYCDDNGSINVEGQNQEDKVKRALTLAWNDIEESYIEACTTSFLARLDAIIQVDGWYTKY